MTEDRDEERGERMRRLRLTVGLSQLAFAKHCGLGSRNQWTNIERGFPITAQVALKLKRRFPGLSLDWIYFGTCDGLTVDMARRLGELGKR